jgi:hypothetical protein
MPDQELIDGLIATYRELNAKVRSQAEDRLRIADKEGRSVRDVVSRMRDSELRFSQALKERVTGVPMPEMFDESAAPVVGTEGADDSTNALLSQFGTARESTLALLRTLPDDNWDETLQGGKPIRTRIQELRDNDRRQVERIVGMLGAP